YLPGSLQGKISSDGCLKKEQMVVSAIASTPQFSSVCTPVDRKNGDLLHNEEAKRLPLLMHVNHKSIIPPIYVYFM
ncbi:hypothetical protein, partial [Shigella boydii]|uniref:hypothetical protein n=1 Tax=Shigella boydii TaxID=621 RepID=UPI00099177A8